LTQTITEEQLVEGAIIGMLDSLGDPHTAYMNHMDYEEATTTYAGEEEYEGIGAWVDISKDYLTIITPFPDSPAEKAGLMPGDKILAIDGEDMTGLDGELVRQKVLGPAGTTITLTILRDGLDPFDVDVTRGRVLVPSVEARMLENDIAYLRLFLFGDKSDDEVHEALEQLLAEEPVGLIFDLRINGGGSVDTAVAITSEFIEQGVIFSEIYGDGQKDIYEANGKGLAFDIPLVVLVDEGSASASEIMAGAIQDYGRAPLVGTRTFGKGSVQYWIPLSNDKGAIRVTIASWVTPEGRQIHQQGLEPDFPIIGIPQSLLDEGFDLSILEMDPENIIILSDEEVQQSIDVQLDKAIEILLEQTQ
jgi:carboxyl-terminal processing protease